MSNDFQAKSHKANTDLSLCCFDVLSVLVTLFGIATTGGELLFITLQRTRKDLFWRAEIVCFTS